MKGNFIMSEYKIGTKAVQGGYTPKNGEPRQIPIIQSTTFKYDTSEDMGKLFDLEASGYFYSRPSSISASAVVTSLPLPLFTAELSTSSR